MISALPTIVTSLISGLGTHTAVRISIGISIVSLAACSSGNVDGGLPENDIGKTSPSTEPEIRLVTVRGLVQKGPFNQLFIEARTLDENGSPVDNQQPVVEILENNEFRVEVEQGEPLLLEASGEFVDETSGEVVTLEQPLRALLVPEQDATQNINIATDLVANAALGQLQQGGGAIGPTLMLAEQQALGALGFSGSTPTAQLNLNGIPATAALGNDNLQLLLLSAAVMQLPRPVGQMAPAWSDIGPLLGQQGVDAIDDVAAIWAGLQAQALFELIQNNNVVQVPELVLDTNTVWQCGAQGCGFTPQPSSIVSVTGTVIWEGAGGVFVTVRRSGDVSAPVELELRFEDDGATNGEDYVGTDQTVRLAPNQRQRSIFVPIVLDTNTEADEAFVARLLPPADNSVGVATEPGRVIITDGLPSLPSSDSSALAVAKLCIVEVGAAATVQGQTADCPTSLPASQIIDTNQNNLLHAIAVLQGQCTSV